MDLAARKPTPSKHPEGDRQEALDLLTDAYAHILQALGKIGYPVKTDDNFAETAERAAKALLELVRPTAELERELTQMLDRTFHTGQSRHHRLFADDAPASGRSAEVTRYDEMVISKHNTCFGMCPHHLLPVIYRVSVAYLPGTRVLGISKLSRMTHLLARRPVLQEDLTHELAEILHERLETRGSAAYVEGLHLCMAARGIEAHEARVVTSAVRGVFRDQPATRQEFLDLVTTPQASLL
jgi:GTP cyclohydrolase I